MVESDASGAGMTEQLHRLFPDGKWPEFPWKKGCRRIAIDLDVASALLALIPNWAGDWADFAPYLRRTGYTPEELPRVTVKIVSAVAAERAQENMERRASRGLTISAGLGTCTSTFTTFEFPTRADGTVCNDSNAADAAVLFDERTVKKACSLTGMRQAIVVAMLAFEATSSRETCQKDIIQGALRDMKYCVGNSFASHSKTLRKGGLIDSQTCSPYGYWLTDSGVEVATYLRDSEALLQTWFARWREEESFGHTKAM